MAGRATVASRLPIFLSFTRTSAFESGAKAMNVHQGRETKGRIGQRELDDLIGAVGGAREVEDIYPLSGLQQGLLFHSLYAPQSAVYVVSVTCRLGGPPDVAAVRRGRAHRGGGHTVLRTA